MEFLVFILLLIAGAAHLRIGSLQDRVELLEAGKKAPAKTVAAPQETVMEQRATAIETDTGPDPILKWLSTDWPMKLGAFLVLLAFGWLTTYAFINNWIGPMGRIVLGLVSGVLIVGLGEWRIRKFNQQGAIFMDLGGAVILVSLFAARNVYDFFTPLTALIAMFAVAAYLACASVRHKNSPLAIVALLMGAAAPLLINSPNPDFTGLFSYLFVLCSGTLWVLQLTKWKVLPFLALLIVSFYGVETPMPLEDKDIGLVFAVLFSLLFYACNLFTAWTEKKSTGLDIALALGSAVLSLTWLQETVPDTWSTGIFGLLGVVFTGLAYLLYTRMPEEKIPAVYLVTGAIAAGLALYWELDDALLNLALIAEGTLLILGIAVLTKKSHLVPPFSLLLLPSILLSAESFDSSMWAYSILHLHTAVLLSLSLVLLFIAYYLRRFKNPLATVFWGLGGAYAMGLIWLSCNALIANPNLHVTVALGIYTVAGLIFNLYGVLKDNKDSRIAGGILIGIVVARLLLVDVWEMALSAKIITFFIIGALLISTAFFNKKLSPTVHKK